MPDTTPAELIVAIDALPPVHVPPAMLPVSVEVTPGHTATAPLIVGAGLTVTTIDREQPDPVI